MSSRLAAQTLTELGSTLLYVLAAADLVRAAVLLLAVSGVAALTQVLPPPFPSLAWPLLAALGAAMAAAAAYSLYIARAASRLHRAVGEGRLGCGEARRLLRAAALDMLLSLVSGAWLSLAGLALLSLGLALYCQAQP